VRSKYLSNPIYKKFDEIYLEFQRIYGDKDKRVQLFGKFIFIDYRNFIKNKSELFWHLSSIETTEKYDVNPCTNEVGLGVCKYIDFCENNIILDDDLIKELKRIPCIYRSSRILWVDEIIRLANEKSEFIKIWEVTDRRSNKQKIKIRFQNETVDYIIILSKLRKDAYKLITAFPIVYKRSKQRYNKQFNEKMAKKKPDGS